MQIQHVLRHAPATGALAASVALIGAGPALASGGADSVIVQPAPVSPGEEFSVFDGGRCPGGTGEATFGGAGIPKMKLSMLSDQVGGTGTVPKTTKPGSYTVTITCGGGRGGGGGGGGAGRDGSGSWGGGTHKPPRGQQDGVVPKGQQDGLSPDGGAGGTGAYGRQAAPGGALPGDGSGAELPDYGAEGAEGAEGAGDAGDLGMPMPGDGAGAEPPDYGAGADGGLPGTGAGSLPPGEQRAPAPGSPTAQAGPTGAVQRAVAAASGRKMKLTGTMTVVAGHKGGHGGGHKGGHEDVPKGGSEAGVGGASGTGVGTTVLGGTLLAGAVGWGLATCRRHATRGGGRH
ncbi:hypothetical protein [Streptomyces pinistramenti]|uniref:hypothetical protein n=1 Tax=Streptomyces pinistramenti TaxID=2884812 RepID=UPI001D096963|nr:hypothetical protein [Streptomyces pinistramenti]MCB5911117.1 hypothetical protein [Streptomyces pinistramenti]